MCFEEKLFETFENLFLQEKVCYVLLCFALLTCCAASQCKQKNNTLQYFRLWFISIHRSVTSYKKPITGYNKPIIGCEKNRVSHP